MSNSSVTAVPVSHTRPYPNRSFMPAKDAAKLVDYSSDYVSRLAREGKVVAEQRNRQWYVSVDSLKLFVLQQKEEQRERQRLLREERLREYAATQQQSALAVAQDRSKTHALSAALVTGVVATCMFLLASLGWVVVREQVQVAQLYAGAETTLTQLRAAFPDIAALRQSNSHAVPTISGSDVRIVDGALVVSEGTSIGDAFSDPVDVRITESEQAIIVPAFASTSQSGVEYRLDVTPIKQPLAL